MSFRLIAERLARMARATAGGGWSNGSEREALRAAEELIAREKRAEDQARKAEAARKRAAEEEKARESRKPVNDPSVVDALAVFGLLPGTPFPQITAAYRQRIVAVHPDRNPGHAGASTEQTQQLNAAYALLKKVYGR